MPWTLAAAAFLILYATLAVVFHLRPHDGPEAPPAPPPAPPPAKAQAKAPAAEAAAAARRARPTSTIRETPASKKSNPEVAPADLPLLSGDDEDDDITIVTLGP